MPPSQLNNDPTHKALGESRSHPHGWWILLFLAYFIFWLLPRWPAIAYNVLQADDYLIFHQNVLNASNGPFKGLAGDFSCTFPPQDGRWGAIALFCMLSKIEPTWVIYPFAKYAAGAFMALFGTLLTVILRTWRLRSLAAVTMVLVILSHPIWNEVTLWNSPFFASLWFPFCAGAYILSGQSNRRAATVAGVLLLLCVVLSYEIYFSVFITLVALEPVIDWVAQRPTDWRAFRKRVFITLFVVLTYVVFALLAKGLGAQGRGFVQIDGMQSYLIEKVHGLANLLVNVYMPIASYFIDPPGVFRYFKWILAATALFTFAVAYLQRQKVTFALIMSASSIGIMLIPTAPVFLMNQSPEAWRVSAPVLIACVLALVPSALVLFNGSGPNRTARSWVGAIFAALAVGTAAAGCTVSAQEAKYRILENEDDKQIVRHILAYWQANPGNVPPRVGIVRGTGAAFDDRPRAGKITVAYHGRGVSSGFTEYYFWRSYLFFQNIESIELEADPLSAKYCGAKPGSCLVDSTAKYRQLCKSHGQLPFRSLAGYRVAHDVEHRISVICA